MHAGKNKADLTDNELLACVNERDTAAFHVLYCRYFSYLRRFLARLGQRDDSIDELINDIMLVVWERASSFNGTSKVSTWILGIAYNKSLKAAATHGARPQHLDLDEAEPLLPGVACQGIRGVEGDDWMGKALALLSEEQRAVMELTCVHGLHYQEIAQILGCPENTVKTRMYHAKKKLKCLFAEAPAAEFMPCFGAP